MHHHVLGRQAADCALKLHGAQNELRQAAEKLTLMVKQQSDAAAEHASTQHILQVSSRIQIMYVVSPAYALLFYVLF